MKNYIIRYASLALAILGVVACSEEHETAPSQDAKSTPMSFVVTHPVRPVPQQQPLSVMTE